MVALFDVSGGVLLAHKYENTDPTGLLASEKYDGVRAIWDGSQLKSRSNKNFYAPDWFLQLLPSDHALDGELYIKRGSFENTFSVVSKKIPVDDEWKQIKYMLFDLPSSSEKPFENRLSELHDIIPRSNSRLQVAKHTLVKSREHMDTMLRDILSKGGEGIMLRNPASMYQQKRTKNLLKVKPNDDAEAVIVGMVEGKGKDSGRLGALEVVLKSDNSIKFKIGSGLTDQLRENLWSNKNSYIGDTVTFGYTGVTKYGVPRHPVFIRKRVDKAY